MFKALLKKQCAELLSIFTLDRSKGKRRSLGMILLFVGLAVYIAVAWVMIFWEMTGMICEPFVQSGMTWVYFALLGLIATVIGIFLGAFMGKSKLYEAKDNDLLLSMPCPPWMILCSRVLEMYLFIFVEEVLILATGFVRYFTIVGVETSALLCAVGLVLVLPLITLAICCLLGLVLAWVDKRLPAKNVMTYVFTAIFAALYFWAYSQMGEWLTAVLQNGGEIQQAFQTWLYPLWQMGLAAQGDWSALLIFSGISIACFALVFFTIFKTYLHLLTMNKGGRIIRSRYKGSKKQSVLIALLKKECIRILHSPMYLLNCAIGTIMMIGGGVYCVVTGSVFGLNADMVASIGGSLTDMSLLVAAIGCALASMNILTAPSVSLEGESIWILQTSPVSARQILESKLAFHLLLTLPGVLFCGIVFSVLLQTGAAAVLAILVACLFAAVSALFGLFAGLKFPNLHWTNEMAVIKQGVATMVGMFGSFGIILLLVGGYFLIGQYLPAAAYLAICAAVLGAVTAFLWHWLVKKGAEIFRYLS